MVITNGFYYYTDVAFTGETGTFTFWLKCNQNGTVELTPYSKEDWTKSVCNLLFTYEIGVIPEGFEEMVGPPSSICYLTNFQEVGMFGGIYPVVSFDYTGTGVYVLLLIRKSSPPMFYPKGTNISDNDSFVPNEFFEGSACYLQIESDYGGNSFPDGIPPLRADYEVVTDEYGHPYIRPAGTPTPTPTPSSPTPSLPTPSTPTPSVPTPSGPGPTNLVMATILEENDDTLNLDDFEDFAHPDPQDASLFLKEIFTFGAGSPAFIEWVTDTASGQPIKLFRKGVTHTAQKPAFLNAKVPVHRNHLFEGLTEMSVYSANQLYALGGYADLEELKNWVNTSSPVHWNSISDASLLKVGEYNFYQRSTGQDDSGGYTVSNNGVDFLLDEEKFQNTDGGLYRALGVIIQGWRAFMDKAQLGMYGVTVIPEVTFDNLRYDEDYDGGEGPGWTNEQIDDMRDAPLSVGSDGFVNGKAYFDLSPAYHKVPVVEGVSKFEMEDGEYVLEGGKRVLRRGNWSYTDKYGKTSTLYENPPEWWVDSPDYIYGTGNKPPKTDIEWAYLYSYTRQDVMDMFLVRRAKYLRGNYDTFNRYTNPLLGGVFMRMRTEQGTYGGNDPNSREVGDTGIKLNYLLSMFSDIRHYTTWEIGRGSGASLSKPGTGDGWELQAQGMPIWKIDPYTNEEQLGKIPITQNPYKSLLTARQSWLKTLRDYGFTDDNTLKYLNFNMPYISYRNKEIQMKGIYQGDRMLIFAYYFFNDPTDSIAVQITAGATTVNFDVIGDKEQMYAFTVPAGLSVDQFSCLYSNVDGLSLHLTGKLTGLIADHYA